MIKIKSNILFLLISVIFFASCSDIIEPNLKDEQVNIIAPGDNTQSTAYSQLFWWDIVKNASQYRIQIVSPNFSAVTSLLLDTIVAKNKVTYSLNPGTYQWRIRAENGSSQTEYFTRNIVIDTSGLVSQIVQLINPSTALNKNTGTVTFSWQSLFGTTNYKLEVDTITGNFAGTLKLNQLTPLTTYSYIFPQGNFIWRVRATNATEQSQYSEIRSFLIDWTSPTTVTLSSPASNTTYNRPITLSWTSSSSTDVAKYKMYAYDASLIDTTILSSYPKDVTVGTSFSFTDGTVGHKILWRVTAVDYAGNESNFSAYKNFTIGL